MASFPVRPLPAAFFAVTALAAALSVGISVGVEPLYDTVFYPTNALALGICGLLVVSRERSNAVGWLLSATGLEAALAEVAEGYGRRPGLPYTAAAQDISALSLPVGVGMLTLILVLFPTGRPLSPGWRPVVWLCLAGTTLQVVALVQPGLAVAGQLTFTAALVGSVASVVVRFRRSRGVERQQLKWVAYVLVLLAVVGTAATFAYDDSVLVRVAIAVVATAFPVSVCVAILRYRLYDIDVIITRTLVYAVLTLVLAGGYAAVAVVLGTALGGARSSWATAGATLAAAAAFLPLRRRLQDVVDRRFRPARYDALAQVDAFLDDLRAGRCAPDGLEPLLRELLHSPQLRLHYLLPDLLPDRLLDREPPDTDPGVRTLVERAGTLLAVVVEPPATTDEGSPPAPAQGADPRAADLRAAVLDRAGLAIEIGRLQAVVTHQLAEVVASRARIVAAGHEERRRLERDLHDGAQQRLVSVGLALRHAQHQLGDSPATETLEQAVEQVGAAIADLRELANGVRPAHLDGGLGVALRELASRSPLPVELQVGAGRYPPDVEATAYFVACEALTNAVKHSAASAVRLHTHEDDGMLVLTVQDDGVGGALTERGSGLRGLVDRVSAQGGQLLVRSGRDTGTAVVARLPCAS